MQVRFFSLIFVMGVTAGSLLHAQSQVDTTHQAFLNYISHLFTSADSVPLQVADSDSLTHQQAFVPPIPNILDSMPNVRIFQDSSILHMLQRKRLGFELTHRSGFRVQVYASNMQQSAKNEAIRIQQQLEKVIDQSVYILSEPPFWKVRVGDFLTREQANEYKAELLLQFPNLQSGTYVVPDQIVWIHD